MDRIALLLCVSIISMVIMVDYQVITIFVVPQSSEQIIKNSVQRGFLLTLTTHALIITILIILLSRKAVILTNKPFEEVRLDDVNKKDG